MSNFGLSDSELIVLYGHGNEEAFEALVNRHKSKIFTKIYLIVKDQYIAEDILQEVFIKVINTIQRGKYKEEGKFLPWVNRIAHNLAIDHFRKQKRYPTIVMENGENLMNNLEFSEDSYESKQIRKETHAKLREMIQELPDSQKEVLIMRHFMKMSFQEIAASTEVSINTALGRMRYALINLKKNMIKNNIAYDQDIYP